MTYTIRSVLPADETGLYELARHLNTVNLPHDRARIREIVERSAESFAGTIKDPRAREYVFVLEDLDAQRLVGTSMIVAQLGRRETPYIYFDVRSEEKVSQTLDKYFCHTVLRIGYSYSGPTEIGGLIVHPEYRKKADRLGQAISYVRFLFIAARRQAFQDDLLAELLPPLEPDGTSHLWEALGRHFTEMSYAEADLLSKKNKEFIKSLFPDGDVYASLLPPEAQAVIGKVGTQTRGVQKLLLRIGFRYANRIDPFDGGPHFTARTDEVTLVAASRRVRLGTALMRMAPGTSRALVGVERTEAPEFRAVVGWTASAADGVVDIDADSARALGVLAGDEIVTLPL
jgi:arginine N-succinyltransferase